METGTIATPLVTGSHSSSVFIHSHVYRGLTVDPAFTIQSFAPADSLKLCDNLNVCFLFSLFLLDRTKLKPVEVK